MLDIGWQELFIIAIFAILVIGPKDLPRALKTVMHWVRKARGLAREFQSGVDEMVREADLDDVKQDLKKLSDTGDLKKTISDSIDPTGELSDIQSDLDKTAREATKEEAPKEEAEEDPYKNKSGEELRVLMEKEKQKKAMAEAAEEAARVESEAVKQAEAIATTSVENQPASDTGKTTPEKSSA